ncbi:hypothetical protein DRQ25_09135 [Candidatus Fermentibacteria bacterium]|nr:MAG: hypothetical protein DRQ25_09135 [Candidatus Fermentibacteria bacterium]
MADNVSLTFASTPRDVQPGNGPAPDVVKGSAAQSAEISADLWELGMQALEDLTGGLFTKGAIAGTVVTGGVEDIAADTTTDGGFTAFTGQQYDESVPTAIGIIDTSNSYVLDTDYRIIKMGNLWGALWMSGSVYDPTLVISVTSTYTPASEEYTTVGGTSAQTDVFMKVTQIVPRTDVTYDVHNIWEFFKCFQTGDLVTALKNKDDTDPAARIPLTMTAELDSDRAVGSQLMKIRRLQVDH